MATLQGTKIKDTYPGLVKFANNGTVDPTTLQQLTDGTGGSLPISLSQVETKFQTGSLVDFTGTTVTGLPSASGLINDAFGIDSLITNPSLTTNAAEALYSGSIAIGNGAQAYNGGGIAIGANATMPNQSWQSGGIAIGLNSSLIQEQATAVGAETSASAFASAFGKGADATGFWSTSIGYNSLANSSHSTAVGRDSIAGGQSSVAVGHQAKSSQTDMIAIGRASGYLSTGQLRSISIGTDNGFSNGAQAISIGYYAAAKATDSVALGRNARVDQSSYTGAIAIGDTTKAEAIGAIALGADITANRVNTLSTNQLELQEVGGGITMYSPNGSEWLLTVTDTGDLLITGI